MREVSLREILTVRDAGRLFRLGHRRGDRLVQTVGPWGRGGVGRGAGAQQFKGTLTDNSRQETRVGRAGRGTESNAGVGAVDGQKGGIGVGWFL